MILNSLQTDSLICEYFKVIKCPNDILIQHLRKKHHLVCVEVQN